MKEIYRFRSVKQLLDEPFRELENQSVYFASPEQLNDPMEGFRDIVWRGDKVVWNNLFKHYVHSLHWTYHQIKVFRNQTFFDSADVPVLSRWDLPATPEMGELFKRIWHEVRSRIDGLGLSDKLGLAKREVRREELAVWLDFIHSSAIMQIIHVYVDYGIVNAPKVSNETNTKPSQRNDSVTKFKPTDTYIARSIQESIEQNDDPFSVVISILNRIRDQWTLIKKYDFQSYFSKQLGLGERTLLIDFVNLYIQQLDALLWPKWYTACFSRSYNNSSLWGHYGDAHKGICLIFEAESRDDGWALALSDMKEPSIAIGGGIGKEAHVRSLRFQDVNYLEKPSPVDFFSSISIYPSPIMHQLWYTGETGEVSDCAPDMRSENNVGYFANDPVPNNVDHIVAKSRDWSHELESRLILVAPSGKTLSDEKRTFSYDFNSLKGVIFGIRTSDEDKMRAIDVINKKCKEAQRSKFEFHQAYYCPKRGDIQTKEMSLKFSDFTPGIGSFVD